VLATFAPDLVGYTSARVGKDALASLTVFLVALPLCLGIAIASGAPPAAGIVTGIVGGLVVGVLTGSPLQVSGPAAGLAVLVWEMIQGHGIELLGAIVLLAGAIQVAAGLLGLGQWFRAVSPAVIKGMLAGIGVLIFAAQFHVMVDDAPQGSGIDNLLSIPSAIWKAATPRSDLPHAEAAATGLLTIVTIVAWGWLVGRTQRTHLRNVPPPLAGVLVATAAASFLDFPIRYVTVPDSLFDALVTPTWSVLGVALEGSIFMAAVAMAFVASAETLLCATATDQMHGGRVPTTRYDRELWAQGVGNVVCGALGALPMTGVIVRSSANVQAGATSRASTIMHGAWLLLLVVVFPGVLRLIPVASLAGVLVFTGYKLVDPKAVRSLWALGWAEFGIYATTLVTIVAKDLLTGVVVGIGLAAAKLLYTFSHLEVRLEKGRGGVTTLHLEGAATFVRLPKLAAVLERVPATTELHVRLEDLSYIDHACLDLLMNWEKQHENTGGRLVVDWETLHARFRSEPVRRKPNAREADAI